MIIPNLTAETQLPPKTLFQRYLSWLNQWSRFLRWQDWGFSKIPLICTVCFYIALTYHYYSLTFWLSCLAFLLFAASHSALAYVMNDWGDRFSDRQRGKWNAFLGLSQRNSLIVLGVLVLVDVLSALPFVSRPWFLFLWLIWFVIVGTYLLPPLHLKRRGRGWGVLAVSAQWILPACLAFAAFGHFGGWDMMLYALVLAITGTSLDQGRPHSNYGDKLAAVGKQVGR